MKNKNLLLDRDFLFKFKIEKAYSYLIHENFIFILIRNNIIFFLIISRQYKINFVMKYEAKKEYFINIKNYSLTIKISIEKKPFLKKFVNLFISKFIIKKIIVQISLKT